jgi:hypothetical protein
MSQFVSLMRQRFRSMIKGTLLVRPSPSQERTTIRNQEIRQSSRKLLEISPRWLIRQSVFSLDWMQ